MAKRRLKTWKDYWRVTLYLDKQENYELIHAAADLQDVSASQWIMRHALRHARRELKQAKAQPSDQTLLRAIKGSATSNPRKEPARLRG